LAEARYLLKMFDSRESKAIAREFGRRVKIAREAKGWTQQEASALSGVPQPCWSRIESGLVEPGLVTVLSIANGLRVKEGTLLVGLLTRRN
jgi:transcriptional regulator with XRE-family HTH domain